MESAHNEGYIVVATEKIERVSRDPQMIVSSLTLVSAMRRRPYTISNQVTFQQRQFVPVLTPFQAQSGQAVR
jgi:hypothetical protein